MAFAHKTQTLRVTVNGREYKRTTAHRYLYVLVGRVDEDRIRTQVYTWTPYDAKVLREYYTHNKEVADGSWYTKYGFEIRPEDEERREASRQVIAKTEQEVGEEMHRERIARFEEDKLKGKFLFHVISWHNEIRNAESAKKTATNRGYYRDLQIVKVGDSVTIPE